MELLAGATAAGLSGAGADAVAGAAGRVSVGAGADAGDGAGVGGVATGGAVGAGDGTAGGSGVATAWGATAGARASLGVLAWEGRTTCQTTNRASNANTPSKPGNSKPPLRRAAVAGSTGRNCRS